MRARGPLGSLGPRLWTRADRLDRLDASILCVADSPIGLPVPVDVGRFAQETAILPVLPPMHLPVSARVELHVDELPSVVELHPVDPPIPVVVVFLPRRKAPWPWKNPHVRHLDPVPRDPHLDEEARGVVVLPAVDLSVEVLVDFEEVRGSSRV